MAEAVEAMTLTGAADTDKYQTQASETGEAQEEPSVQPGQASFKPLLDWNNGSVVAAGRGGVRVFISELAGETMPLSPSDQSLLAEALDEVPELSPSDRTRFGNALGRLLPPCF